MFLLPDTSCTVFLVFFSNRYHSKYLNRITSDLCLKIKKYLSHEKNDCSAIRTTIKCWDQKVKKSKKKLGTSFTLKRKIQIDEKIWKSFKIVTTLNSLSLRCCSCGKDPQHHITQFCGIINYETGNIGRQTVALCCNMFVWCERIVRMLWSK